MQSIRAISLDLDDTLWSIWPVIYRAEDQVQQWLKDHCPDAAPHLDIETLRQARIAAEKSYPHLVHDFTAIRRNTYRDALKPFGYGQNYADAAFDLFFEARHEVEFYPDVLPALELLASHYPLVALSNGNADLDRLGISHLFDAVLNARMVGVAKPDTSIFLAVSTTLGIPLDTILHIGDHPVEDIGGARRAGMKTAWINRNDLAWDQPYQPDTIITTLDDIIVLLDLCAESKEL
ncbi:MAG: HAD family hydrolase [Arenicellales bacterium]|jgi:putative hydrolase of the HAD superfamily|nr:HAD family hydrolase [Arenicellales bacterium]MDP7155330.1 HAD family hydrolase [Arenicellales bacterium]MDP7284019.1 HAD family hydrolase [Arenicellales bacterium]MDP7481440.1 HAD family hydrolase [Arenicellales bacterium]MEE1539717.1 HAD family hydrolase [Arenicellales bacterium]|tara:strand:- start:3889 stop:4593 length:705 start_codon:yes stop_codon:yes gene_type:complete